MQFLILIKVTESLLAASVLSDTAWPSEYFQNVLFLFLNKGYTAFLVEKKTQTQQYRLQLISFTSSEFGSQRMALTEQRLQLFLSCDSLTASSLSNSANLPFMSE